MRAPYLDKVERRWQRLERLGLVSMLLKPDDSPNLSFLEQDEFADYRRAEYARANNDGVWGIVGVYHGRNVKGTADSCWGFIGEDWKDSGYDIDIKANTIEQFRAEIRNRCRCCMGLGRKS